MFFKFIKLSSSISFKLRFRQTDSSILYWFSSLCFPPELLSLLFHYDYFSSQKSSLRITKLERRFTSSPETIKLLRPPSITENLQTPMDCGTGWGLIRLIPTSFWFVMIRYTGASWFLPTQGVVSRNAPIGAPMLVRHSSALRSLIHMARRVAWHLVKKVMMSTIKGASVSAYDKFSPFQVPW